MIARILEMDSMVCVVSRTKISDNDDLFAMVYFSALEVERLDLTMSWDNKNLGAGAMIMTLGISTSSLGWRRASFATVYRAKSRCAWAIPMWPRSRSWKSPAIRLAALSMAAKIRSPSICPRTQDNVCTHEQPRQNGPALWLWRMPAGRLCHPPGGRR